MSDDQASVVTLKVRVAPEFREKIVKTAKENNRSMNQEIVARLEGSFTQSSNGYEQGYESALNHAALAIAKVLGTKGIEWSEIQKTALLMLDEAKRLK